MPPLLPTATHEKFLKIGGVTVVDGTESTNGHERTETFEAEGPGGGIVLMTQRTVVIAKGSLTNVDPENGVGRAITVDGTARTITGITTREGNPALLELLLAD